MQYTAHPTIPQCPQCGSAMVQTFADREGLIQALQAAGTWVHLLPRLDSWAVITDHLAWLQVLERGVMVPPAGYEAVAHDHPHASKQPFRRTIATIPASEVRRWH